MTETMNFRKGGEAAKEAAKSSGAQFAKTNFLKLPEEDPTVVLRYITDVDDWIYVDQHGSVPTKNKPEGFTGNWPTTMTAVCRKDEAFSSMYSECYICDDPEMQQKKNQWGKPVNKTTIRIWALAVIREAVVGTAEMAQAGEISPEQIGKRLGYKDATREVAEVGEDGKPIEGKTRQERAIVVVNQAGKNYFDGLLATSTVYGTVCDRDFIVKRTGTGKDTEYNHISLEFTENLHPAFDRPDPTGGDAIEHFEETESWARYAAAVEEQGVSLPSVIARNASDDHYGRFFDPSKTVATGNTGTGQPKSDTAPVPAAAASEVDEAHLAAMRERIRGGGTPKMSEVD